LALRRIRMKSKIVSVCLFVLLLTVLTTGYAESKGALTIGSSTIYLGQSKGEAIELLQSSFNLSKIGPDSWTIMSKGGPPFTYFGSVTFQNNAVSVIQKSWGSFNETDQAEALIGILKELVDEKNNVAIVDTSFTRDPNLTTESAILSFDQRQVTITIIRSKLYGTAIEISETAK
jgi:hypothetical protein